MPEEKRLKPFRQNTLKKLRPVGQLAFADGGNAAIDLPRVGYLSAVWINLRGTLNLGGAGAFADLGPWNILKRIGVNANFGGASLWDTSGFGAYVATANQFPDWLPDAGDSRSLTPPADCYGTGVANGNNTYNLWYRLPIAQNQGLNFQSGLILLQSTTVTVTVNLQFGNAAGDLVASLVGGTGFTGTAFVYYDFYEVPDVTVEQPPLVVCRTLEESQPILAQGEVRYNVPPGGTLTAMSFITRLNALRNDAAFDRFRLYLNQTETRLEEDRQWLRMRNRVDSGMHLPTGCYSLNLMDSFASGLLGVGDSQNSIDTEEVAELQPAFNITGALGAGTNEIRVVRRILQLIS